ncbi:MAG: hypothetical protein KDC99_06920 [Cyclobacteriaceae bacterium]|nr:hypothetical protein [Cyclobacteriaceae bacterium]
MTVESKSESLPGANDRIASLTTKAIPIAIGRRRGESYFMVVVREDMPNAVRREPMLGAGRNQFHEEPQ